MIEASKASSRGFATYLAYVNNRLNIFCSFLLKTQFCILWFRETKESIKQLSSFLKLNSSNTENLKNWSYMQNQLMKITWSSWKIHAIFRCKQPELCNWSLESCEIADKSIKQMTSLSETTILRKARFHKKASVSLLRSSSGRRLFCDDFNSRC